MDKVDFLASCEMLSSVALADLAELSAAMKEIHLSAGTILFREGEAGDAAFLIQSGELALMRGGVRLLSRSAGECVGEFSLIDDAPRSATAVAVADVRVLSWDRKTFLQALSVEPKVAFGILRSMADKLRQDLEVQLLLEKELITARDMQMGLMPKGPLLAEGFDISGKSLPATHVGGDFFQYFRQPGNKLHIVMADVTGHSMQAAIPAVMFDGILVAHRHLESSVEEFFTRLNHVLFKKLDRGVFICFSLAEIDTETRSVRFSNGGCPRPIHYRAATDDIVELIVDAYPLGVRADTSYRVIETQLEAGDRLVFFSDGIPEATSQDGELFGFEATAATIHEACTRGISGAAVIEQLMSQVQSFTEAAEQLDDMTCVVVAT